MLASLLSWVMCQLCYRDRLPEGLESLHLAWSAASSNISNKSLKDAMLTRVGFVGRQP